MAIPVITEEGIKKAIEYIDGNGVPTQNQSTMYNLVMEDGKKYPPKYVIAVARKLESGEDVDYNMYNAIEAKNYFETRGYLIESKQEKYELTITADSITSTDERFDINNLYAGDKYKIIDVYFMAASGAKVIRKRNKGEYVISNKTLPRLVCQIYEKQLEQLSDHDRENFPICHFSPESDWYRGIFYTRDEYKQKYGSTYGYVDYRRENGAQFYFYSFNVFSTIYMTQECLRRFGNQGDKFVLIYKDKSEQEQSFDDNEKTIEEDVNKTTQESKNLYSKILLESKNMILHGAPGTGKSYLAKEIAADIISNGYTDRYEDLTDEQKQQVEFVQFHPSYDYSDFVEGLRPIINEDGNGIGFELQDGIFKAFVDRARKNFEDSLKSKEIREQEISAKAVMTKFFSDIEFGKDEFQTVSGNKFTVVNVDEKHIYLSIPGNNSIDRLTLNIDELRRMLESGADFEKVSEVTGFFGKQFATQGYSYDFALYKAIKKTDIQGTKSQVAPEELKKYIFIIDEINRGEISKIFGELFFAIDPGYRGKAGEVSTQYSNMHVNPDEKFYIPKNVYVIGTMNDIDRSVDTFDFAMRRRFRFKKIKAADTQGMLETLGNDEIMNDAVERMDRLNAEIIKIPELNEDYQVGAAYFLKLKSISFDVLWTDYLQPLLQEYVRGMYDEENYMEKFARAYGYIKTNEDADDEADQG